MDQYTIRPADQAEPPFDFEANDPSRVLSVVQRIKCHEANVEKNGHYAFSLRLSDSGVWRIFERRDDTGIPAKPVALSARG